MPTSQNFRAACYQRLSREDGDKVESDSILNQLHIIEDFCARNPEFSIVDHYADDGYTGTNFERPAFQRMLHDIEEGKINCVIVKDLSRFGRNYIDAGYYLERYFPAHGVRFVAVNDNVDSAKGQYDMILPFKNVMNSQYAKDISDKVRSSFKAKQRRGEFVGAFASYGYLKDPDNHNRLIIDPVAAQTVKRIFELAASGIGQVRIAKLLNEEAVPCPSDYKRLMGMKYRNCNQLQATNYWTYATIHRMLQNEMYLGRMVQSRSVRKSMHGKAVKADKSDWIVVPDTHPAIISQELWDTVQAQLNKNTREIDFEGNIGLFAGFLKCGDCGRAMTKTTWNGRVTYSCGSYHRYGTNVCSSHYIRQDELEAIILSDLNRIIATVGNLRQIVEASQEGSPELAFGEREIQRLRGAIERIKRLKQSCYEDYKDQLLSREEYIRYKADYDQQEETLSRQLQQLSEKEPTKSILENPWVAKLLAFGKLDHLDRSTLAQAVKEVRIYEDKHLEITYLFSEELRPILESGQKFPNCQ